MKPLLVVPDDVFFFNVALAWFLQEPLTGGDPVKSIFNALLV